MGLIVEYGVVTAYEAEEGVFSVTVPEEAEEIGDGAFLGAVALREVRLHGGIRRIGDGAFDSCFSLETVRFGGGVEVIGEGAFRDCSSLKTLSLPPSVTYLGAESFAGCSALKAVKLPSRIRELPEGVFRDCWALEAVGEGAFLGCDKLMRIEAPLHLEEAIGTPHPDCLVQLRGNA